MTSSSPPQALTLFQVASSLAKGDPIATMRLIRCFLEASSRPDHFPYYQQLEQRQPKAPGAPASGGGKRILGW